MSMHSPSLRRARLQIDVLEGRDTLSATVGGAALAPPFLQPSHVASAFTAAPAQPVFETAVVARGLARPTGIAVGREGTIYFTQTPTPGVAGGANSVAELDRRTGQVSVLHMGEPEPANIVVGRDGTLYWTCKSAGVILQQTADGVTTVLRSGLSKPTGIALDPSGRNLYYTEIPTPGVSGAAGGLNKIHRLNLRTMRDTVIHSGDPEPSDLAVDRRGNVYWTCTSAGVIVRQDCFLRTEVIARGLNKPVGIAIDDTGRNLYFTEVPTPGVPGSRGGMNTVNMLNLRTMNRTVINAGDPEPTDVAVDRRGNVYWTCTSAGVIVSARLVSR